MQPVTPGYLLTDGTATLMARLRHWDNALLRRSDVDSIVYTVFTVAGDSRTAVPGHTDVAINPAESVFDELQTDARWNRDDSGYNFRHTLDIATAPLATTPGSQLLVALTLTPVSGQPIRWDYLLKVL